MSAALLAAVALQDSAVLSLTPPGATQPDAIGREFWLHFSAYSAWVTTLLLTPALFFIWFPHRHAEWRAFWATSFLAYLIHLAISAFGFFGGDFGWMTSSSRVSAFWPGMVLAVWWGLDVALSGRWGGAITMQRVAVHLMAFVLFFGGSAIKGETAPIQIIGWVLAATALGAVIVARINRLRLA